MIKMYAHFEKSYVRETVSGCMVPRDYSFWPSLMQYFISKSKSFRIDCWSDEREGIKSAQRFGKRITTELENMEVFEGEVSKGFIEELTTNPFDSEGKIKWFSVFLRDRHDELVLSCEHYGGEFNTGPIYEEDIAGINSIIPADFSFFSYNMEQS